jgi:hypothetical protein
MQIARLRLLPQAAAAAAPIPVDARRNPAALFVADDGRPSGGAEQLVL